MMACWTPSGRSANALTRSVVVWTVARSGPLAPLPILMNADSNAPPSCSTSPLVVGEFGGLLLGESGLVDLVGVCFDAFGAFLVEDVAGVHGGVAEQDAHGVGALFRGEFGQCGLQLAGEVGQSDEVALAVVQAGAELLHLLPAGAGRGGQADERGSELLARGAAGDALAGERGEGADGVLDAHAHLAGCGADHVEGFAHVAHVALGGVGAGGEQVGDVAGLAAVEAELAEGAGGDFGGFGDVHVAGGGEVERAVESSVEDVLDAHAGLGELVDRVGGFGGAVDGTRAGFDGLVAQCREAVAGGVGVGFDPAHGLVEFHEALDGGDADGQAERADADAEAGGGLAEALAFVDGLVEAGGELLGLFAGGLHAGGVVPGVGHEPDHDVRVELAHLVLVSLSGHGSGPHACGLAVGGHDGAGFGERGHGEFAHLADEAGFHVGAGEHGVDLVPVVAEVGVHAADRADVA